MSNESLISHDGSVLRIVLGTSGYRPVFYAYLRRRDSIIRFPNFIFAIAYGDFFPDRNH